MRVEGQNHLPQPAGHTSFHAAQNTVRRYSAKILWPFFVVDISDRHFNEDYGDKEDSLASHRKSQKCAGLNKRMSVRWRHLECFHNPYMREGIHRNVMLAQAMNLISVLPFGTSPILVHLPLQHPKAGEAVPGLGLGELIKDKMHIICASNFTKKLEYGQR